MTPPEQEASGSSYLFLFEVSTDCVMSHSTRRSFRYFNTSAGFYLQEEERCMVKVGDEHRMRQSNDRSRLVEIWGTGLQNETDGSELGIVPRDNAKHERWPGAGESFRAPICATLQILPRGSGKNTSVCCAVTKRVLDFGGRGVARYPRGLDVQQD